MDDTFVRVGRSRPCPACGKADWCMVSTNGADCLCQRVDSGDRRGDAGWLHRHRGAAMTTRMTRPPKVKKGPARDWKAEAERHAAALRPDLRAWLETRLGLPPGTLACYPLLGVGRDEGGAHFTFPEWDGEGRVVGLCRRYGDGSKFQVKGGGRGLSVPHGFDPTASATVFVAEGATDVAALTAAGLPAVGRPSNTGGAYELAALLRACPDAARIVLVGENDEEGDHDWPGLHGAAQVADHLGHLLDRRPGRARHPVAWALCPDGAKDARAWLTAAHWRSTPWADRGRELAEKLSRTATPAEPVEKAVRKLLADHAQLKRDMAEVKGQMRELLEKVLRPEFRAG